MKSDPGYLKWLEKHLCIGCHNPTFKEPTHHIRDAATSGTALKPPDRDRVPFCKSCHDRYHDEGRCRFWGVEGKQEAKEIERRHLEQLNREYDQEVL